MTPVMMRIVGNRHGANQTSTSPTVMGPESKGPVMTWLSLEHNLLVSLTGVGAGC
jgi:hypothetical protein